ncbi:nucleoid-structuring protein H-NS [Pseudomonas sp. PAMC 29040]|nr:nucleoid-structuring protein H-NS [Pseudomonas sp. PAMC 29040]
MSTTTKVSKKALPQRTAFAALRFPRSGPAPWPRRDGPSMAQHGSPGIHAGRTTTQNLLSASRRGQ